jgi:glycosyltransferase involved in cell wall biosynthesis
MGDTLLESLESILEQIEDGFEVILVDDGSTDNSIEICRFLSEKYSKFRFIELKRDSNRLLGETRNFSVSLAKGKWCIFHLDSDDFIGPYIADFVQLVETLSSFMDKDVLFAGQQIHMAKKDFLLSKGPFLNIYRGEDRDLYFRLVKSGEWIVISHKRFIHRLNRDRKKLIVKTFRDLYDQSVTDLRTKRHSFSYLFESIRLVKILGYKVVLFRFVVIYWAWKRAQSRGALSQDHYPSQSEFVNYRSDNTRSATEWLRYFGVQKTIGIDPEYFY